MHEHDDPITSRLTRDLHGAARDITAPADLGEVEHRAARVRTRRRAVTGVAAAAIVAAAGGAGFGIGRSVSSVDNAGTATQAPGGSSTTVSPTTTVSDTAPDATPAAGSDTPAPFDTVPATTLAPVGDVASSYYGDGGYYGYGPYELVTEQTTDDGIRVRVLRGPQYDMGGYPSGWQPAPYCYPNGDLRVTFDGPDLVDVTGFPYYTELFDGVAVAYNDVGIADRHPLRVTFVQSDTDAASATVTWDDGVTATAPIVDGVAMLVADMSAAADLRPDQIWELGFAVELAGPSGVRTVTKTDLDHYADPDWRANCEEPPPALPDPGEQPADPDAGQALLDRFAELWSTDVAFADKPTDLLDDWTGVLDAIDSVNTGGFADTAGTAEHVVDEYVFTSPTEAWLRYSIFTDVSNFTGRYATATLVDGVWQFPRAAVCQDLGLAGEGCQPWVDAIYPPSWYERYGNPCYYDEESGQDICDVPFLEG